MDLLGIGERDQAWLTSMYDRMAETAPECAAIRIRHRADTIYLLVMGGRVITMQTGFAMLESAYGEKMNAANIMMKNTMDLLMGAVAFFFLGYWIAFDAEAHWDDENNFDYAMWFTQFSYATTAATIDSGALAGRVAFGSYVMFSIFLTGIIYPWVVNWTWAGGWLADEGFIDFAGSVVVHMVGAMSAFVSAAMLGPRIGRYPNYRGGSRLWRLLMWERREESYYRVPTDEIEKAIFITPKNCSNPVQALYGLFVLIIGFLAFNPASTLSTVGDTDLVSARTTVTTLMAASGGAFGSALWSLIRKRRLNINIPDFATSILGSLVSSCACCHVVTPAVAMLIGCIGALIACASQVFIEAMQIDDPVGAISVHGPPGVWGALSVPIFAKPHCVSALKGLIYGGGAAAWEQLGTQCLGVLSLGALTAGSTYVAVVLIRMVIGFRAERAEELIGLDYVEHGYDDGTYTADTNKIAFLSHTPIKRFELRRGSTPSSQTPSPDKTSTSRPLSRAAKDDAKQTARETGGDAAEGGEGGAGRKPSLDSDSGDADNDVSTTDQSLQQDVAELKRATDQITDQLRKMKEELARPQQRVNAVLQLLERAQAHAPHSGDGHPHSSALHALEQILEGPHRGQTQPVETSG